MLQLLYQRLNLSSFFLHLCIPLRGSRRLSNLCGQKFILNAYCTSAVLICGNFLKVYKLQKNEILVLRLHSCRGALTCGGTLAASALLFPGLSPEFPLKI